MNKYNAIKTTVDGITFHSKKEAGRYSELRLLQKYGKIDRLTLQPSWKITINFLPICRVVLDFQYFDMEKNKWVYEDVKGGNITRTPVSRLKHKMLAAQEGIQVSYV